MNQPVKLFIGIWSCAMMIATILLIREYCYIVEQSYKIASLKSEYENHLMAASRLIYEYNALRERSDNFDQGQHDEKKNETHNDKDFPDGVRIISSQHANNDFVVINRESEHLKKKSISYIEKQQLMSLLGDINPNQWRNYTESIKQLSGKKVTRRKKSKRQIVSQQKRKKVSNPYRNSASHDFEFSWPVARSLVWLSSLFGPRKKANGTNGFHGGIDMAARKGTPVCAAAPGVVVETRREKDSGGWGNTIVIAHNHKYRTRYAHLDTIKVVVGQQINRAELIGTVGDTGRVRSSGRDASHLHFELCVSGKKVDPLAFLSRA